MIGSAIHGYESRSRVSFLRSKHMQASILILKFRNLGFKQKSVGKCSISGKYLSLFPEMPWEIFPLELSYRTRSYPATRIFFHFATSCQHMRMSLSEELSGFVRR